MEQVMVTHGMAGMAVLVAVMAFRAIVRYL